MNPATERPAPATSRAGRRLLVVDDQRHVTAAVSDFFTKLGYEVDEAGSEAGAVALLERFNYSAVVTDLRLSGSVRAEGLEIVGRSRRLQPAAACIVLTAYGDPEQEREARRLGADALLRKPTPLPLLARHIADLLARRASGVPR